MPGYGARYWADRTAANRRRSYPKFKGAHTADVVVIGGGLTGCMAASVLAGGGLKVVLLEADRLAEGSTAGSLGAIVPQPDTSFRDAERLAGMRAARTAFKETSRSAKELATALRKLPIKTDLAPASFVLNAPDAEAGVALKKEQAARKSAGADVVWLSAAVAHPEIGTDTAGAIRLKDAGLFDPVRAALGFAASASGKNAEIFEGSGVLRTRFTRKYADVFLEQGTIRTTGIFVATGEPGRLFGQLERHVRRAQGFAVVTEPLSAAMAREAGRRSAVQTEWSAAPHFLRWLPDGRAMFMGGLSAPVPARQLPKVLVGRTAQLMYELSLQYPAISGLPAHWGWSVPVVTTPDGLPWIGPHRNFPFHFFALAFGWHGDAMAWLAARAALRHFTGEGRREDESLSFARYL
jgi:glycine/D-amino acid oxidase-like deaminating enzyme